MTKTLLSKLSAIIAKSDREPMAVDARAEDRLDAMLEDRRDIIARLEDHLDFIAAASTPPGTHGSNHLSQIN
jgi:hypothetical protein